jgi:creatinine amidohydrolase
MTAEELNAKAGSKALVLLPVASTEQHGPHLGTGVDTFLVTEGCRRVAVKVAEKRPVVVAPTVWMGLAEHHIAFGGSFTLGLATYHALLRDLVRSILRAGFERILIVNGHGGNIAALSTLVTDLTHELSTPLAVTTLYSVAQETGVFAEILEDQDGVQHACEAETSMMLAAFADCVRQERLKDAYNPRGVVRSRRLGATPSLQIWRSHRDVSPSGVVGDARKASAAKGERLLEATAAALAEKLIAGAPWA